MNKLDVLIKKYYSLLFAILILGGTGMYLLLIGGRYVWADETYTFAMIKHSFGEMWSITAADVHPPLYYILLKPFAELFGYSLTAARVFSVIPYIVILIFGGVQFKKLFSDRSSILFMVLFLLFPFALPFAVEVRMYSLAAMFVFMNGVYGYRCFMNGRSVDWIMFALTGTCAAYTHYFAMVSVGVVYLILLVTSIKQKKPVGWIAAAAGTVILYIPWLSEFIEQLVFKVNNEYWIGEITARTVAGYLKKIFESQGEPTFFLFSFAVYLAALISVIVSREKRSTVLSLCMLAVPVGTVAIGLAASLLVRPVFIIRYIMPAIPILVAFMAVFAGKLKSTAFLAVILTVSFIGGVGNYAAVLREEYTVKENGLDSQFLEKYSECDSYVVISDSSDLAVHLSGALAYYGDDRAVYVNRQLTAANPYENKKYIDDFDPDSNDVILFFTDPEGEIPAELFRAYNVEFLCEIDESGNKADAYLLTR